MNRRSSAWPEEAKKFGGKCDLGGVGHPEANATWQFKLQSAGSRCRHSSLDEPHGRSNALCAFTRGPFGSGETVVSEPAREGGVLHADVIGEGDTGHPTALEGGKDLLSLFGRHQHAAPDIGAQRPVFICGGHHPQTYPNDVAPEQWCSA